MFYANASFAIGTTCTLTTPTSVSFGNYNPFNLSAVDTTGSVQVTCSGLVGLLVNYTVTLNPGLYGTFATRQMANAGYRLNYNVYTDAARSMIWGDGTSGTSTNAGSCTVVIIGSCSQTFTAYGRIPAQQNAGVGDYADTITVTVTY